MPIGGSGGAFTGAFQGQGNTISNLTMTPTDSNANNIGLFALNFGTIQNLHLTNVSVTANPNIGLSGQSVGTLAGQNYGTINNVTIEGISSVNGGTIAGVIAGGLVGQNWLQTITQSRANVNVTLGNGLPCNDASCSNGINYAGGLVGLNAASITQSSASGNVTGGANSNVGGLVGVNSGSGAAVSVSVTSSYATGNVTGTGAGMLIGGLVGMNWVASIANSYATGAVNGGGGSNNVGGLAGFNGSTVTASYATGAVSGNGTVGGLVGGNYNAVDVNGNLITVATISGPAWNVSPTACSAGNTCYSGIVTVGSGATGGGLVGSNQGSITNAFAIANVTGAAGAAGTISNNNGNSTKLGGLVGGNEGQITNSLASGTVGSLTTANLGVGGLVGGNNGTISGSFANVVVSAGDNSIAGGLVGTNGTGSNSGCNGCDNTGTITHSIAYGSVTAGASSIAGGLVGVTAGANGGLGGGSVSNTTAYGAVTAGSNSFVGGLVGVAASTISASSALNTFAASTGSNSIIGGLVGFNAGSVTTSSSTTPVSGVGSSFVGGLIGINVGTVTQSKVDFGRLRYRQQ